MLDAEALDFEEFGSRRGAMKALVQLERAARRTGVLAVTHGDACLQNLLEHRGRFVGFVDCGRVGIADRYQDIALACDSISDCFGAKLVSSFLMHYGVEKPNQTKMEFYRKLDAFY